MLQTRLDWYPLWWCSNLLNDFCRSRWPAETLCLHIRIQGISYFKPHLPLPSIYIICKRFNCYDWDAHSVVWLISEKVQSSERFLVSVEYHTTTFGIHGGIKWFNMGRFALVNNVFLTENRSLLHSDCTKMKDSTSKQASWMRVKLSETHWESSQTLKNEELLISY